MEKVNKHIFMLQQGNINIYKKKRDIGEYLRKSHNLKRNLQIKHGGMQKLGVA